MEDGKWRNFQPHTPGTASKTIENAITMSRNDIQNTM